MRRAPRGALVTIAACAALVVTTASPAAAGGTWLEFDSDPDAVAPGDTVRGSAWVSPGTQGSVDDGPFHVHLRPETDEDVPQVDPTGERIGPLAELRIGERSGPNVHVEVEFVVPDLPPGGWWVEVCNADCAVGLGDLMGGRITIVEPTARDALPNTGGHTGLLVVAGILLGAGALTLMAGRLTGSTADAA